MYNEGLFGSFLKTIGLGDDKNNGFQTKWKQYNTDITVPGTIRELRASNPASQFNPQDKKCEETPKDNQKRQKDDTPQSTPPNSIPKKERFDPRYEKFLLLLASPSIKIDELKNLCWNGIPPEFRSECWKLLLGYTPLVHERWESTVNAKRQQYWSSIPVVLGETVPGTEYERNLFDQIQKDVPRTNPNVPLFQLPGIQKALERILYLWSIRHPASGYVQGINDLVTPFFAVFLQPFIKDPIDQLSDISQVSEDILRDTEADCYWCLTKFIDSIHDHYTFAQPGIQRLVFKLKEIIQKIDAPLNAHLSIHKIDYIQFAFRWMNCLLMRELPLKVIIRMWDTYLSEDDSFSCIHVYICAAFLLKWSVQIQKQDFQEFYLFIQNLPTHNWLDPEIEPILSQAYLWKTLYNDSPSHLKSNKETVKNKS